MNKEGLSRRKCRLWLPRAWMTLLEDHVLSEDLLAGSVGRLAVCTSSLVRLAAWCPGAGPGLPIFLSIPGTECVLGSAGPWLFPRTGLCPPPRNPRPKRRRASGGPVNVWPPFWAALLSQNTRDLGASAPRALVTEEAPGVGLAPTPNPCRL